MSDPTPRPSAAPTQWACSCGLTGSDHRTWRIHLAANKTHFILANPHPAVPLSEIPSERRAPDPIITDASDDDERSPSDGDELIPAVSGEEGRGRVSCPSCGGASLVAPDSFGPCKVCDSTGEVPAHPASGAGEPGADEHPEDAYPEGETPTDIRVMREANGRFAQQAFDTAQELRRLADQLDPPIQGGDAPDEWTDEEMATFLVNLAPLAGDDDPVSDELLAIARRLRVRAASRAVPEATSEEIDALIEDVIRQTRYALIGLDEPSYSEEGRKAIEDARSALRVALAARLSGSPSEDTAADRELAWLFDNWPRVERLHTAPTRYKVRGRESFLTLGEAVRDAMSAARRSDLPGEGR